MIKTRLGFLVLIGLVWLPFGYAQNISGAWSFKSELTRKGCTLTGNMTISPAAENGIRTCSFVSIETCEAFFEGPIKMDQSCRITPQGDGYIIRSQVVGTLTEGYNPANYLADHFIVRPSGPKEMKGISQDTRYSAPVIFWRDEDLPVS